MQMITRYLERFQRSARPRNATSKAGSSLLPVRRMDEVDREFLPAALELLETPPSPVMVAAIWLICAIFAIALVWSYFGWIEIYAVAQGRIQPSGRSKVVQSLDPGRVVKIAVENGRRVAAGDLLIQLIPEKPEPTGRRKGATSKRQPLKPRGGGRPSTLLALIAERFPRSNIQKEPARMSGTGRTVCLWPTLPSLLPAGQVFLPSGPNA